MSSCGEGRNGVKRFCKVIVGEVFFGQKLRAFSPDGMATVEVQHPSTALDHEGVDLGVVIGMKGEDSPQDLAKDHVDGTLTTVALLFGYWFMGSCGFFAGL